MNRAGPTPGSQTSLREANRGRVVDALVHHGAMTQVELAGITGLSAATVSNIVKELTAAGVLQVTPVSRSGRRASQVSVARTLGLAVGVDFGDRHLHVAVADLAHTVVAETRMPLRQDHLADEGLDRAALLVGELVSQAGAQLSDVVRIAVGVPAPIDTATGEIGSGTILTGWGGVRVAEEMQARLLRPTLVDNDANLGALAEVRYGAARGSDFAAYIKVSHGVGAGLVVGGEIFRGRAGTAGEIGHVTIDENGPVCRCGNRGCLETFVRAPVLLEMLRNSHGNLSLRDVIRRAREGDAGCRRVIADAGRHIGVAVASLCNLLNPERIVVGGGLADSGDLLLEPMRDVVSRFAIPTAAESVTIVKGELGARAQVLGAVARALQETDVLATRG
jgi:predicted NBD/HSP70 family sugar kinase